MPQAARLIGTVGKFKLNLRIVGQGCWGDGMLILSVDDVELLGAPYPEGGRIQYQQQVFERRCSFGVHQRQQAIRACQKYLDSHTRGCLVVADPSGYTVWTYVADASA